MSGVESDTYTVSSATASSAAGTNGTAPGFKRDRKQYRLRWAADHEFAGLEVTTNSLPLGQLLDMTELAQLDFKDPANLSKLDDLFTAFTGSLISWNLLGDDDQPVPPTVEGLRAQDMDLVLAILEQWMTAIAGVPAPLGQRSPNGLPSVPVASIPMEPRSPSPPN